MLVSTSVARLLYQTLHRSWGGMERNMERHGNPGDRAILQGPEHGGGVTSNWDP